MSDAIEALIAKAVSIVDAAKIPNDLRAPAFAKTVDLLTMDDAASATDVPSEPTMRHSNSSATWMQDVSVAADRNLVELEELFFMEDDEMPRVGVNPTRLGNSAAQRSRKIALLIAGARQVGNIEQSTTSESIREECKRLGVFDISNFGKTIGKLKDWFNITGSGSTKVLRIKPGGRDAFRDLIGELLGDGQS